MEINISELEQALSLLDSYLIELEDPEVDNYRASLLQLKEFIVNSQEMTDKLDEVRSYALVMAIAIE